MPYLDTDKNLDCYSTEQLSHEIICRENNSKLTEVVKTHDKCSCCMENPTSEYVDYMVGDIAIPLCSNCYSKNPITICGARKPVYCDDHPL